MDKETLEALKASIAKWERNAVAEKPEDYKTAATDCPLCGIFLFKPLSCSGCPVSVETGRAGCDDTPFDDALEAHDDWMDARDSQAFGEAARKAAQAEVDFLKSLLPESEQV